MTAFLFDLDGTLCHTEPLHFRALQDIMRDCGQVLDEAAFARHCVGETTLTGVKGLLPHLSEATCADIAAQTEARFRDISGDLKPLKGLIDLFAHLETAQAPTALVTNAPREDVNHMLGALGLRQRFDTIVVAGELARAKPDPMPYVEALRRLDHIAEDAVAFEDSVAGITSATGAGIFTVGIETTLSADDLIRAGARLAIKDFTDPRVLSLAQIDGK